MYVQIIRGVLRAVAATSVAFFLMANHVDAGEGATAKLEAFHSGLLERYPEVTHISADALQELPPKDVVLFDVRKRSEFDVSRIGGAIRVSPSIDASAFLREHAASIKEKTVVFYCSVGERSSRLAERVMSQAGNAQPAALYNLEGGIFKWHNEYKDVVGASGETSAIHPFNRKWGRLLERQEDVRTKPEA